MDLPTTVFALAHRTRAGRNSLASSTMHSRANGRRPCARSSSKGRDAFPRSAAAISATWGSASTKRRNPDRLKTAQLLAEGKTDAALDEYAMALKVLRHRVLFSDYTNSIGAFSGNDLEDELLDAAEMMLRRYGHDPAFCRGLLTLLDRHAEQMPTFPDLVKACYAMFDPRPAPSTESYRFAGPLAVLFDSPIETIRDDRLQRAFCRGLLKAAEEKALFTKPWRDDPQDHVWPGLPRSRCAGAIPRRVDAHPVAPVAVRGSVVQILPRFRRAGEDGRPPRRNPARLRGRALQARSRP